MNTVQSCPAVTNALAHRGQCTLMTLLYVLQLVLNVTVLPKLCDYLHHSVEEDWLLTLHAALRHTGQVCTALGSMNATLLLEGHSLEFYCLCYAEETPLVALIRETIVVSRLRTGVSAVISLTRWHCFTSPR